MIVVLFLLSEFVIFFSVFDINFGCVFIIWSFIFLFNFVNGIKVVIEFIIIRSIVFVLIKVLIIFKVCFFEFGWDKIKLLILIFKFFVYCGSIECLVLIKVVILLFF